MQPYPIDTHKKYLLKVNSEIELATTFNKQVPQIKLRKFLCINIYFMTPQFTSDPKKWNSREIFQDF